MKLKLALLSCLVSSIALSQNLTEKKYRFSLHADYGIMPYKVTATNPDERLYITNSFYYGFGVNYSYKFNSKYKSALGFHLTTNSFRIHTISKINNTDFSEKVQIFPILGVISVPINIQRIIYKNKKLTLNTGVGVSYSYYNIWGASLIMNDNSNKYEVAKWDVSNNGVYYKNIWAAEISFGGNLKVGPKQELSINCILSLPVNSTNVVGKNYIMYSSSKDIIGEGTASNPGRKLGLSIGYYL